VYNLLLLPAALLLFIWGTAANEFELYLWDTAKCQPRTNTEHIQTQIAYPFYNSLWHHHPDCYSSCWLIFLPCVCLTSIYASMVAKSYFSANLAENGKKPGFWKSAFLKTGVPQPWLSFNLLCDFPLIARSGTCHVTISVVECAPHT